MEVKVYEGFDMKDVVKNIKRDIGSDAVILESRQKNCNGSGKKIIEVKAASSSTSGEKNFEERNMLLSSNATSGEIEARLSMLERKFDLRMNELLTRRDIIPLETSIRELKSLLMTGSASKNTVNTHEFPRAYNELFQQLKLVGVAPEFIDETLRQVQEHGPFNPAIHSECKNQNRYYRKLAIRAMAGNIRIRSFKQPESGPPRVCVLIGASGVGKTTMMIKIARHLSTHHDARVLLVELEDEHLHINQNLPIYAKILNIPFVKIENVSQLQPLGSRFRGRDTIFLDLQTNPKEKKIRLNRLQTIKKSSLLIEFHLVLSLRESSQQIERCISEFAPLGLESVIFTKLDDSLTYGEIYNVTRRWGLPLTYFGTGTSLSSDLEKASRESVMERLFGL